MIVRPSQFADVLICSCEECGTLFEQRNDELRLNADQPWWAAQLVRWCMECAARLAEEAPSAAGESKAELEARDLLDRIRHIRDSEELDAVLEEWAEQTHGELVGDKGNTP